MIWHSLLAVVLLLVSQIATPIASAEHHASAAEAEIVLGTTLHFSGPSGADVVVAEGRYRVRSGGAALHLVSAADGNESTLAATEGKHDVELETPLVLAVPDGADAVDLVMLLPGGTQLAAAGSESGVSSRTGISRSYSMNAVNVQTRLLLQQSAQREREDARKKNDRRSRGQTGSRRAAFRERARAAANQRNACTVNASSARALCRNGCDATADASCATSCAGCLGYGPCVTSCLNRCVPPVRTSCRGGCDTAYSMASGVCNSL